MNPTTGLLPTRPTCADDTGSWCARFYELTNNDVISRSADVIVAAVLQTTLIVVVAVVARYLLHRLIYRVVEGSTGARVSRLVSRAPALGRDGGVSAAERSAQRARTIGSVLRSIASVVIGTAAAVMVLAEFNINLSPILASAGIVGWPSGSARRTWSATSCPGCHAAEDQYGVGDIVDVGVASARWRRSACGSHAADGNGTVWYVRNGESSAWAKQTRLRDRRGRPAGGAQRRPQRGHGADRRVAAERVAGEDIAPDVLEPPEVLGVERVVTEGITLRLTVRVNPGKQFAVQRALNAAITSALDAAGVPRPGAPADAAAPKGPASAP